MDTFLVMIKVFILTMNSMTTYKVKGVSNNDEHRELSPNSAISFSFEEHFSLLQLVVLVLQPQMCCFVMDVKRIHFHKVVRSYASYSNVLYAKTKHDVTHWMAGNRFELALWSSLFCVLEPEVTISGQECGAGG